MIEPTETESPRTLERFAKALEEIVKTAQENPEHLKSSSHRTSVRRIKEAEANRKPILRASLA
ncbi:hypothetical protein A7M93_21585 [Acinetobacter baumannii]|nr:hypothetical protein A7M93_21585 [Acinetobacter baumannii]